MSTTTTSANFATLNQVRNLQHFVDSWNSDHSIKEENATYAFPYYAVLGLDPKSDVRVNFNNIVKSSRHNQNRNWWTPSSSPKTLDGSVFLMLLSKDHIRHESPAAIRERLNTLTVEPLQVKLGSLDVIPGSTGNWGERNSIISGSWRVVISVPVSGHTRPVCVAMTVQMAEKVLGLTFIEKGNALHAQAANGQSFAVDAGTQATLVKPEHYHGAAVFREISDVSSQNAILMNYMRTNKGAKATQALRGIQKTWKKVHTLAETTGDKHPKAYMAFRDFVQNAPRSVDRVRVSKIFNQSFKDVTTEEQFLKVVAPFTSHENFGKHNYFDEALREMGTYKDDRKTKLKSQTKRAHVKLMRDLEFVNIDEDQYPLTFAAVRDNKIPLGTFFSKKEQYFLSNDNWDLWEKMLKRFPDVTIALAQEVSRRSKYEKDLMSYFYCVLYALPEYLTRHTGRNWSGVPELLNDASKLDSTSMANGVSKTRSAMTPIVDHDKLTVTVPFVSVLMPGRFSTYCYAHSYNVLRRGTVVDGNTVIRDVEKKLNGKDDYGLMYYTLIGTERGTGYPTFLIIFERLEKDTKVHIHRVNPSRSKDGDPALVHNWTKNCYNWMAGNVPLDRIKTSQGDLMFVEVEDELKGKKFDDTVNNFDSHTFDKGVAFCKDVPKSQKNLLGYAQLQADTWLRHPEHEDRLLKMGLYEIRQARSYENNPAGNWSLTID